MNIVVVLLLCLAEFAAHASNIRKRVVGGVNVKPNEFPYHATLNVNNNYVCGATLISKSKLLTAAHCLDTLIIFGVALQKSITVLVASLFKKYGIPYEVIRISHHKGFKRLSAPYILPNDLGFIHLKNPIIQSRTVAPIRLPTNETTILDDQPLLFSGFGCQDVPGRPAERLAKIVLRASDLSTCQSKTSIYRFNENQICALSESGSGCSYGDDGSGITDIDQKVVLGILSVSKGHADSTFPDIFTKVSCYLDYINEELNYNFNSEIDTDHPAVNYPRNPPPLPVQ